VTRVAVVDVGSNSTRLLLADVQDGRVRELDRRTTVTRLGEGVERNGRLGEEPQARVLRTLDGYRDGIERADVRVAVLTSAVRDAANGAEFAARVGDRYGLDARTLTGEEEARLTFRGATAARAEGDAPLLVIDIGGGSTELVVGARGQVSFHASTQNGVVRHSERHLHHDPPPAAELLALAADVDVPVVPATAAVAVAGTATSCAAIDLALEPYDAGRVEGHVLSTKRLRELRDELAALPLARRRQVKGLHPDRAPTIVAGVIILLRVLERYGLERVEVSDHDILWGAALACTSHA
jgi:exopolyphosphatase / guanosine-5'-triphosphate,3'-diphosphate pyrophosphatase